MKYWGFPMKYWGFPMKYWGFHMVHDGVYIWLIMGDFMMVNYG